jgi:hypothetical protein
MMMMMMMIENYKIENHEDPSFQNFSSRIVFSLNVFDYSKTFFQNLVRGVGWGGVVQEHESPKKKFKTQIQSIFQSLKVCKSFFVNFYGFFEFFSLKISWGERWGVGEGLYRNPNAQINL